MELMKLTICKSRTAILPVKDFRLQVQLLTLARYFGFTPTVAPSLLRNSYKIYHLVDISKTKWAKRKCWKNSIDKYGYRRSFSKYSAVQHLHSCIHQCSRPYGRDFGAESKDSDINRQNKWLTTLPKQIQPYLLLARIDRPIGYWLLFIPCSWSISLAADAGSLPNFKMLGLFFAGSLVMRSSGCVINDLWDVDLDKKVARTSSRPLASGQVSKFEALVFLASQLSVALGILLSLNNYSIVLGASSLLLVSTYPLMKRITFWPQLFLGLTFNWGCLLGWSAVTGSLDWSVCLPLYAAAVNWTLFYDTIYAFQDVEDDRMVGIKSTALLFGNNAKPYLAAFAALMNTNLLAVGINSSQTWPFYFGLFGVFSHMAWQLSQVDLSQPKDCLSKFKSNKWLGIILTMSIIASTLLKPKKDKDEVDKQIN